MVNQEDITILNIYYPNNKASKCMKQKCIELQRDTGKSTIMVRNFITPLSINRSIQENPVCLTPIPADKGEYIQQFSLHTQKQHDQETFLIIFFYC